MVELFFMYWEIWFLGFYFTYIIMLCSMFTRFIYVRYAMGLMENGTQLFNILIVVCVAVFSG